MELLNTIFGETATYKLVKNDDGRITELKYPKGATPTQPQVFAKATLVFNPPIRQVTAEDGTVLQLEDAVPLVISLTPAQKTRLRDDIIDLNILVNQIDGKLPSSRVSLALLRERSPILDALFNLCERLR